MSNIKYDPELKKQILEAIKYQGLAPIEASKQFGVHHKTIYSWLSQEGTTPSTNPQTGQTRNKSDLLLIQRLQQENKELKELLGSTTLDIAKFKKKYNPN
jgi:transposase-like protein